jgi:hypothetical protein
MREPHEKIHLQLDTVNAKIWNADRFKVCTS